MTNNNGNILYELAKAMRGQGGHLTAMALRALAQHGYTNLAEVEAAVDCELLAIAGIGPGRLGAIRRLTRPGWQPPSRKAIRTAGRLLSTAQLALRFWSIEDLESTLTGARSGAVGDKLVAAGDKPVAVEDRPVETRLSLDAFAGAACEAADHHEPDELLRIVQRAGELAGHNDERADQRWQKDRTEACPHVLSYDEKTGGPYDQP